MPRGERRAERKREGGDSGGRKTKGDREDGRKDGVEGKEGREYESCMVVV